jgi:hypothetical protein
MEREDRRQKLGISAANNTYKSATVTAEQDMQKTGWDLHRGAVNGSTFHRSHSIVGIWAIWQYDNLRQKRMGPA